MVLIENEVQGQYNVKYCAVLYPYSDWHCIILFLCTISDY